MAIMEIRSFPDPVLRKVADQVQNIDGEIVRLADDMLDTMRIARGAGLAANQVGIPLRLVVIESRRDRDTGPIILINPELIESHDEEITEEGCLSFPGYYEFVRRAKSVAVEAYDLNGDRFRVTCDGYLARACQHEIDHLNGVLFIDHLSPIKKNLFRKKYLKEGK